MTPSLKRDAASGLVVLVPLLVTAYTVLWLFDLIANAPLVGRVAPRLPVLRELDPALARAVLTVGILLAALLALTWIMRTALGAYLESRIDGAFNHVPGFRVVYNASKLAMETAVGEEVELDSPARVEVWQDARLTAFPTGREAADGRVTVFVPASPIIVTGLVIEVDEERVHPVDESPEDALIRVISAGFAERDDAPRAEPAAARTPEALERAGRNLREEGN